ncbi:Flp family type IVb pilin [Halomonas dongshanensis]|uniref:Flp family type IVb pilin n=1 Tax=Halomonas dongshanensis TaxID=2890835 RepID=A0ABT2EGV5_9GAMM|nr:Flp family type IVb pilin [Halomonas dongshanensis]MCS2610791.1 Flp family type IVb pilin [Halomonas dongshanensis]
MNLITFVQSYLATLHRDTTGASAIEYAIVAGLIAAGLILVLATLGEGLQEFFTEIVGNLGFGGGEGGEG